MLTTECNLECRYCFGEAIEDFEEDFEVKDIDYTLPKSIDYDYQILRKFCSKDLTIRHIFLNGQGS